MQLVRIGRKELLAKASGYLERARLIAPERVDVRERTLMVSLVTGQREPARQSTLFLFRKRKEMDDPYGAEQVIQAYLKVFPDSFEILEELWRLYREMGEHERGVDWIFEMVSAAETEGALDRAERLLKRLLEWEPENSQARERLLTIHERQGRREKVAQESLKLAGSLLQQGKRDAAMALYSKVAESAGQERAILQQVAEAYVDLGETAGAYNLFLRLGRTDLDSPEERGRALACLEKARALRPSQEEPYHLMAEILVAEGRPDRAAAAYGDLCRLAREEDDRQKLRRTLDQMLKIAPEDEEAARQQVSLLFSLGETDEGMQILRRRLASARAKGEWTSIRALLADAVELRPDDMELWAALLEACAAEDSGNEAEALVTRRATLFRVEGHPERTVELAEMAVRTGVESVRLRELLATAREDVGDVPGALGEYRALAESLLREGAVDQALATLERCLSLSEDRRPILEDLIRLAAEAGEGEQAARWEKRLMAELSELGRTDQLLEWLEGRVAREPARLDLSRRLVDEAAAVLPEEEVGRLVMAHLERVEAASREAVGPEVDHFLSRLSDPAVLGWCTEWAARAGERERERAFRVQLAETAEEAGDLERARDLVERALELAPECVEAHGILIRILDSLGEEAELAAALSGQARLLAGLGRSTEAVPLYRRLLALRPGDPEVLLELVDLLVAAGNREEATAECMRWIMDADDRAEVEDIIRVFEKVRAIDPGNTQLVQEFSRFLERVGRLAEAADMYQQLSQLYMKRELPDRAIESLRRAKHLAPEDPELAAKLVEMFEEEGMLRAAIRELEGLANLYAASGNRRAEEKTRAHLNQIREQVGPGWGDVPGPISVADPVESEEPVREEPPEFDVDEVRRMLRSGGDEADEHIGRVQAGIRGAPSLALLASMYEEVGRREDAAGIYQQAAARAKESGDAEAACRYLSAVVMIREEDLDTASDLGELEAVRGNRAGALEIFQQVAERSQRRNEFDRAADMYRKMLDLGCVNLAVRTGLAWSLAKAGRGEEACREFLQYGRMLEEKGLPEEAISAYRKAVSLDPQSKAARERLVRMFEGSGRAEDAIREKINLAHTLSAADQPEAALEILHEILRNDPRALKAREALITVYSSMRRHAEELRERKALAQIYLEEGERRKAIAQYEEMLELGEQDPKIYLLLAEEYRRSGDRARARELFVALAEHYAERGMWSKSTSCLLQVLQMEPNDLDLRRQVAETYYHDGLRDKAVGEYLRLAQEYVRQDQVEQAVAHLERAREMDPHNIRILGKIAECYSREQDAIRATPVFLEMIEVYRERGILSKAIEVAKAAIQRFPRESRLHEALAETCLQRGMTSEALWVYRKLAQACPEEARYRARIRRLEQELPVPPTATPAAPTVRAAPTQAPQSAPKPSVPPVGQQAARKAARHPSSSNIREAERAYQLGHYARCLDICRQIIPTCSPLTHLPLLLQAYSLSAHCHLRSDNPKDAIRVLMQALSFGGTNREQTLALRYLLGQALEADGQREQALAIYKKVMEVDPEYADVKAKLEWVKAGSRTTADG